VLLAKHKTRRFGIMFTAVFAAIEPFSTVFANESPSPAARTLLFGSVESGRSTFVSTGFKRGVFDALDRTGFIIMGQSGGGREGPPASVTRLQGSANGNASLLAGYQWMIGWGALTLSAGPEMDMRTSEATTRMKLKAGGKMQAEAWLHPTQDTLIVATVIAGTARPQIWSRLALGYQIMPQLIPNVFAGPEAVAYGERKYVEWRVGAHLTGKLAGNIEGRVSAGWRVDTDNKQGMYWALALHTRL
jgi:Cellulose biosynthesis protein BcsS